MARQDFYVNALDLGTSQVRAVIARCHAEHGIHLLGAGVRPSEGMRKSIIIDSGALTPVIRAAIEEAERQARREVRDVHISISGAHVHGVTVSAVLNILEGDDTITPAHLAELMEKARSNGAEKGRECLHAIAQEYCLDGHSGILNPLGKRAARIEAAVHLISGDHTMIENHGRTVNEAGFVVQDICFSVIAAGHAVLTDQEKKDGVLLIDLGGGTTSYAVYHNHSIYYANVFGVGGDHITNDLALGLRISFAEAEETKCTYARLLRMSESGENAQRIKVSGTDRKARMVLRQDVEMIIDSRVEELLQFVRDDVEQRQCRARITRGVVCTGGVTHLHRFLERAEKVFNMPVRIGIPQLFSPHDRHPGFAFYAERLEHLRDPAYATVLGLVRYAAINELTARETRKSWWQRLFSLS
ncbi:MAG: cell division protein FtsA [bacterium]|nr:cell division protein FtsA [bacterium]